jgi:anoctamin-10
LKKLPEHTIREYFGEQIAMFFKFYSFYQTTLIPMIFLGLPLLAITVAYSFFKDSDLINSLFTYFFYGFAYVIIIWSSIFLNVWNRKENMFALKYGQLNVVEEEKVRKNFKG